MKSLFFLVGLLVFFCNGVFSQIKIGDNPQALHSSSLLELESNERVLVISRINTLQMNAITPLLGALVYNTDTNTIHYYNGTQWINLITGTGSTLNLTSNAIVNTNPTISLTSTPTAFNIEVSPNSIGSQQITNNSITEEDIAPNTITLNTLDLSNIDLGDFTNNAGFITNANTISTTLGNVITDDNGIFYNDNALQTQITAVTTNLQNHITADTDTNTRNELSNLSLNAGILTLSNPLTAGNQVDLNSLSGSGGSNLSNTNLTQTGGNRSYDLNNQNLVFSGNGSIGIGSTNPQEKLHIGGNIRIDGAFIDSSGDSGTTGQVLSATGTGTNWVAASAPTSPFHALGKLDGAVPLNFNNVGSVNALGVGNYEVRFITNASSANYIINTTLLNSSPAYIEVTSQTVSGFTVQVYNSTTLPIDAGWFFSVIDL